jgi:hypothetical protein
MTAAGGCLWTTADRLINPAASNKLFCGRLSYFHHISEIEDEFRG